jgi:hypothetical protein
MELQNNIHALSSACSNSMAQVMKHNYMKPKKKVWNIVWCAVNEGKSDIWQ